MESLDLLLTAGTIGFRQKDQAFGGGEFGGGGATRDFELVGELPPGNIEDSGVIVLIRE